MRKNNEKKKMGVGVGENREKQGKGGKGKKYCGSFKMKHPSVVGGGSSCNLKEQDGVHGTWRSRCLSTYKMEKAYAKARIC